MGENAVECGDIATQDEANILCAEDCESDTETNDTGIGGFNIRHASDEEGDTTFRDLADENDNLLLNEEEFPGIDEYLSFFLIENHKNTESNQNNDDVEEDPLYVNGKSVVRGSDANRKFVCSLCDKAFALKHNLEYHMVIHTGEKAYICGICKKLFALRHHLTQHILIHADKSTVPKHTCTVCGRAFLQGYNLTRHLRVHSGERRFPCFVCNKFFANSWSLQNHLMIHTDDKPYSCEICSRDFRKKCHLQRHLRTHANDNRRMRKRSKTYHGVCSKLRNRPKARVTRGNRSDVIVCQNGKIVCIYCEESFTSQAKLKSHDCDYMESDYLERQVKKRNETVTIGDSESNDDDIDDVDDDDDDDDEDFVVIDEDDDDIDDDDDEDFVVRDDEDDDDDGNGDDDHDDEEEEDVDVCNSDDDDGDDYDDFADKINDTDEDGEYYVEIKVEQDNE